MSEILFDKSKDNEVKLSNGLPTAADMLSVARRHSKEEWDKLCESKKFMDALSYDIPLAKIIAEKILAGKGDILTPKDLGKT
jgi:hypothetical protein